MNEEPTEPSYYVAGELALLVFSYLNENGIQAPTIRRRLLAFPRGSQMPIQVWWQTLSELQALNPDPNLGFEIGRHVQLYHSGVLGYLIAQSETLGDALTCFQRFQSLLHNYGSVRVHRRDDLVDVDWDSKGKLSTPISDQVFIASMLAIVRKITGGGEIAANQLRFQHEAVNGLKDCSKATTGPVVFGAKALGMSFPVQLLSLPINTADPFLLEVMNRQTQALCKEEQDQDQFLKIVETCIVAALSAGSPSADFVANRLNISRRTLHRRLGTQGINYHQALRRTRVKLADMYLSEPQLSLSEVAFLLGYSEQSAFVRAFKRWLGETPGSYRSRLLK